MRALRMFLLCAIAAAFARSQATQERVPVEGTVVNRVTGEPIAGAFVNSSAATTGTISDAAGRFQLNVSRDATWVGASRAGFRPGAFFPFRAPPPASPIRVLMTPEGVIWGRITDDDGFPVDGATVTLMAMHAGKLEFSGPQATSNDLGEFRIPGIGPGRYVLQFYAEGAHFWNPSYLRQYYPGVFRAADADMIDMKTGEQRGPLAIHLTKQAGVAVSGHVQLPPSAPYAGPRTARLTLIHGPAVLDAAVDSTATRQDGTFYFPNVPPGTYTLRAVAPDSMPKSLEFYGEQEVIVGTSAVRGLELGVRVVEPADLAGTVVFEGTTKPDPVELTLGTGGGKTIIAKSDEQGAFVLKGVRPGRYGLVTRQLNADSTQREPAEHRIPAWSQGPILYGDHDLTGTSFYFDGISNQTFKVFFKSMAVLTGRLTDPSGEPSASRSVVFTNGVDRPMVVQTRSDGSFTVTLHPGVYGTRLFGDDEEFTLFNPDGSYVQASPESPTFRVTAGRNPPITLRVR